MAALVAAFLLVLQSTLGAVALGAGPAERDIFGNVICTDSDRSAGSQKHDDGGHLPNCCLPGCPAAAHGAADLPSEPSATPPPRVASVALRLAPATVLHLPAEERPANNPRAPPQAA